MITRKQFEQGIFELSRGDYVLEFLRENSKNAYKIVEIAKEVKRSKSHVASKLRGLVKQNLVERKSPVYIIPKKAIK